MTASDDRDLGDVGTRRLFENERIRAWELRLEPGATSALHRHDLDYVMVQIEGDWVAARFEPESEGTFAGADYLEGNVEAGAVIYAEAGGVETAINPGKETFREVVIELKTPPGPPGLTVGAVIANAARAVPDATAAVVDGQRHSFAELDTAGDHIARRMVAAGLRPGQVALVLAETSFALLAHYVGCARAGVVFAPLNPSLDAATMAAVADRVRPSVVLASPEHVEVAAALDAPMHWFSTDAPATTVDLPVIDGARAHIAFFTSGTTGVPKAAVVSHQTSVLRSHPGAQLEPRGAALCPWPLFHMAGWTIGLQQWHARAAIVFVDGTDAETLVSALREHRIERFNAIPALWMRLAEHLRAQPPALATLPDLRFADTGTSPTSVELLDTIVSLAPNAQVRVFYGSSEAGNVAALHHDDLLTRPGSCGKPSVLTEVMIADDGELLVRSPLLFDQYQGDRHATAAALRDGWYHTGDRAEVDDDGYLSIVGRTGTVIRTGGEAVEPELVEQALASHPAVDDVAVVGLPDERWGEVVCAVVVTAAGVTLDDLRAHVGPDGAVPLAKHQQPRRLVTVTAVPRTAAAGKVDRAAAQRLAIETTANEERP